jgi:hypothetical protein
MEVPLLYYIGSVEDFMLTTKLTAELHLPQQEKLQQPALLVLTTLFLAILALSFSAIFIRLSEENLGPNSTIFNRFWIGAIALAVGQLALTPFSDLFELVRSSDFSLRPG